MKKEIPYGGLATVPSDYLADDGTLAVAANVIADGNKLKVPAALSRAVSMRADLQPLYIHTPANTTNYICYDEEREELDWINLEFHATSPLMDISVPPRQVTSMGNTLIVLTEYGVHYFLWRENGYTDLGTDIPSIDIQFALKGSVEYKIKTNAVTLETNDEDNVNFVGRTMKSISASDVPRVGETRDYTLSQPYALTEGTTYRFSVVQNSQKYTLKLSFSLTGVSGVSNAYQDTGFTPTVTYKALTAATNITFHVTNVKYNGNRTGSDGFYILIEETDENYASYGIKNTLANYTSVMGAVGEFYGRVSERNQFMYPFFIRYAYKLYDGTYVNPSAPCLLIPTLEQTPSIGIVETGTANEQGESAASIMLAAIVCDLQYKILNSIPSDLANWKDIVSSVVIGITPPVFTYDTTTEFNEYKKVINLSSYWGTTYFRTSNRAQQTQTTTGLYNADSGRTSAQKENERFSDNRYSGEGDTGSSRTGRTTGGNDSYEDNTSSVEFKEGETPANYSGLSLTYGANGEYLINEIENDNDTPIMFGAFLPPLTKKQFENNMMMVSQFHIIKEIELDELGSYAAGSEFANLDIDDKELGDTLVTYPTISDNSYSLNNLIPTSAFAYNNRLVLANYDEVKFSGYPVTFMGGYKQVETGEVQIRADVEIMENGETKVVSTRFYTGSATFYKNNNCPVIWFYYPNPNAKRATLYKRTWTIHGAVNNTYKATIQLKEHPLLKGCYWFGVESGIDWQKMTTIDFIHYTTDNGDGTYRVEFYPPSSMIGKNIYFTSQYFVMNNNKVHVYKEYNNRTEENDDITTSAGAETGTRKFSVEVDELLKVIVFDITSNSSVAVKVEYSPETHNNLSVTQTFSKPNYIVHSNVNNPFSFEDAAVSQINSEKIIGVSTAVQALSEGQYGQYPLYVFTNDGVFAMEVASDGTFSRVRPVSRDVCTDAKSITQIDNSVLFATERGIMEVAGAHTSCISSVLDENDTISADILSIGVAGGNNPLVEGMSIPAVPFKEFARNCRMVYDYKRQRIIVFNPTEDDGERLYNYAYVFSIKDKVWTVVNGELVSTINGYPDALAVANLGGNFPYAIVNLSDLTPDYGVSSNAGFIFTRPFSADNDNEFKIIDHLRQNGVFDKVQAGAMYAWRHGNSALYTKTLYPVVGESLYNAGGFAADSIMYVSESISNPYIVDVIHRQQYDRDPSSDVRDNSIAQILYGSNDLIHWFLVASSAEERISDTHFGGGFRWYRLAVRMTFKPNESLSSFTIDYRKHFDNNKLF